MTANGFGPLLVWFRNDLRLSDNPALLAAIQSGEPVLPVYIFDDDPAASWQLGGAGRWWLHHSLAKLRDAIAERGSTIVLRRGSALRELHVLVREVGARGIYWNRCYEPAALARDTAIKDALRAEGLEARSFNANLLFEPWTVKNKAGKPFQVFTPFWRHCLGLVAPTPPDAAPAHIPGMMRPPSTDKLDDWKLLPVQPDWAAGLRAAWAPGEEGGLARLVQLLDEAIVDYKAMRDRPDLPGTSRLSPHLHFGEIGPRQIWRAVQARIAHNREPGIMAAAETFLRQLGWREFSYSLLYYFPHLPEKPLRSEFNSFPWREDAALLEAWQRGMTGFPIVDAGMRELWHTGWMHNRVRMIVASFLVKDLLLPWQVGARWFWDTLVDADLANNTAGWQWTAGCGADAAPYFRVFNPITQGKKFDPDGAYVRRWLPELAGLPDAFIHNPWQANLMTLNAANVVLGETYPWPIVDHAVARERALAAFSRVNKSGDWVEDR